jgi:hypothetical protein
MKVTLLGLYDRGVIANERVHFRAEDDLDLAFFVVLDSLWVDSSKVQAGFRTGYWFPPRTIKKGEHVVLYTRSGTPNTEPHTDGATYHFVFRGQGNPIYTNTTATAVLMEINTWVSTQPAPTPAPYLPKTLTPNVPPSATLLADLLGTSKKR